MRIAAPISDLSALVARARVRLMAFVVFLASLAPKRARAFRAYDRWLIALMIFRALPHDRTPPTPRTRRQRHVALGFQRRSTTRNSRWRFWRRVLPKPARDGAGALARFKRVLRDLEIYAARFLKRYQRGVRAHHRLRAARTLHAWRYRVASAGVCGFFLIDAIARNGPPHCPATNPASKAGAG